MHTRSATTRVTLALVLGGSSVLLVAHPAEAAGRVAPSCVKRQVGDSAGVPRGARVKVTNRCATTKRVKVVFTHAHDSACLRLKPGRSRTGESNIAYPFSHYDKTVTC
jgi:hypothetical protein